MRLHHAHYAGQKLQTQWGEFVCDADGVVEVTGEAATFFQGPLKFKVIDKKGHTAPKVDPPQEIVPRDLAPDEMLEDASDELEETDDDSDLIDEEEEEEVPPVEEVEEVAPKAPKKTKAPKAKAASRFAAKGGKK